MDWHRIPWNDVCTRLETNIETVSYICLLSSKPIMGQFPDLKNFPNFPLILLNL